MNKSGRLRRGEFVGTTFLGLICRGYFVRGYFVGTPVVWLCIAGQVLFALASLDGSLSLPSKALMDQDAEGDYARRLQLGICGKKPHELAWLQREYHERLALLAHFTHWPDAPLRKCDDAISEKSNGLSTDELGNN